MKNIAESIEHYRILLANNEMFNSQPGQIVFHSVGMYAIGRDHAILPIFINFPVGYAVVQATSLEIIPAVIFYIKEIKPMHIDERVKASIKFDFLKDRAKSVSLYLVWHYSVARFFKMMEGSEYRFSRLLIQNAILVSPTVGDELRQSIKAEFRSVRIGECKATQKMLNL